MRLLRPRGRTAFFTVHVTAGLSKRDHRRAVGAGPRAVASRRDHRSLLQAAGFIEIEEGDVTDEFLATAERWVRFSRQLEPELRALQGAEAFDEVQLDRETILGAIREGLLSRSLFVAMRP
jgi:hypothetical protein